MRILLTAFVLGVALTGCGSDDDDSGGGLFGGDDIPDCADLAGRTITDEFEGCMEDGSVQAVAVYNCDDGRVLKAVGDDVGWAFEGEEWHTGSSEDAWNECHGYSDEASSADTEVPVEESVVLTPGDSTILGPDDEGASVEVTLHSVRYPQPHKWDSPPRGRVLVAIELTIRHLSGDDVYGTNVYPNFVTTDGQLISDTGWVVAATGNYGSGDFREELSDSVGPGQYLQGWSAYEIPPEPGTLIFPYGPAEFGIAVAPPD